MIGVPRSCCCVRMTATRLTSATSVSVRTRATMVEGMRSTKTQFLQKMMMVLPAMVLMRMVGCSS